MPYKTEFPYFVPRASAPHVTRVNLKEETLREANILNNYYLWSVSIERGLTYWINPEGCPTVKPVVYWYPRAVAQAALNEMEGSPDIETYKLIDAGIRVFSDFAIKDTQNTRKLAFGPKIPH